MIRLPGSTRLRPRVHFPLVALLGLSLTFAQASGTALTGHSNSVTGLAFVPGQSMLASSGMDGRVILWDLNRHSAVRTFQNPEGELYAVAVSADGTLLAAGGEQGRVTVWDRATGAVRATLDSSLAETLHLAFSPDGTTLAVGSGDDRIRLWSVASGQLKRTLIGHAARVTAVKFSSDGRTLLTSAEDISVRAWNVSSGQEIWNRRGKVNSYALDVQPGAAVVAAAYSDGEMTTVTFLELSSGKELRSVQHPASIVTSIAFSPDGSRLALGTYDNDVQLWDVASGKVLDVLKGHTAIVLSVAYSPDGTLLASGGDDNTVLLWLTK
ncbi:WD40 repeat domain-containing protein [Deinococcus sp. 6YEL10]|uniref:WD40 repeat domain-containing protein n=1 Tax=Deinococcus sp. 6YEL10 TaxID=2745870 RepID=UPI001E4D6B35|nr:WD40 repeat domain-containing protein [Deinococcus sp. 6YEL10]MCD0161469.1 WD40 repeat domain-containing protein [Deinococcus sp. 6YEL10]